MSTECAGVRLFFGAYGVVLRLPKRLFVSVPTSAFALSIFTLMLVLPPGCDRDGGLDVVSRLDRLFWGMVVDMGAEEGEG